MKRLSLAAGLVALAALVGGVLALRLWSECVPFGASVQPYLLASRDGPVVTSPDGAIVLRVVFNDAGAAHSGHHWTWFVASSPVWGRRVVAQGYMPPEVAIMANGDNEPLPVRWLDDRTLEIEFRDGRRSANTIRQIVKF